MYTNPYACILIPMDFISIMCVSFQEISKKTFQGHSSLVVPLSEIYLYCQPANHQILLTVVNFAAKENISSMSWKSWSCFLAALCIYEIVSYMDPIRPALAQFYKSSQLRSPALLKL